MNTLPLVSIHSPQGFDNIAPVVYCTVVGEAAQDPVPLIVRIMLEEIILIRHASFSAINIFPIVSPFTSYGPLTVAEVAGPLSPTSVTAPVPAKVVIIPAIST